MKKRKILDSSALLRFFSCGKGYELIEKELEIAQKEEQKILLNLINLGEIYYAVKNKFNKETAEKTLEFINNLPISICLASKEVILRAADLKSDFGIPFVDAICAASAIIENATILTCDFDFKKVSSEVEIIWV